MCAKWWQREGTSFQHIHWGNGSAQHIIILDMLFNFIFVWRPITSNLQKNKVFAISSCWCSFHFDACGSAFASRIILWMVRFPGVSFQNVSFSSFRVVAGASFLRVSRRPRQEPDGRNWEEPSACQGFSISAIIDERRFHADSVSASSVGLPSSADSVLSCR